MSSLQQYVVDASEPLESIRTEAMELAELVARVPVRNETEYNQAVEYTRSIKAVYTEWKGKRDSLLKPFKEGIAKLEAEFKPALDSLLASEARIKAGIAGYLREIREQQARDVAAAQLAITAGRQEEARALITSISAPAPTAKGASTRQIWHARVVDASKLPREFLVPDERSLDAVAKATKGQANIAGVEFYSTDSVTIRK